MADTAPLERLVRRISEAIDGKRRLTLDRLTDLCEHYTEAGEYSYGCTHSDNDTMLNGAPGNCYAAGCPVAHCIDGRDSIMDGDKWMELK